MRKFTLGLLVLVITFSPAAQEVKAAEVVGNNEVAAYLGSGGLLLPGTYSGSDSTKSSVANCTDCVWAYTVFCMYDSDGLCQHATQGCQPGEVKYRVWFGQTRATLTVIGSVCWGSGNPLTRRNLENYLRDLVIAYVPPLSVFIAPPDGSITSVPIVAWVNQVSNFDPPAFQLGGRTVWLNATATWRWMWGDGAVEWRVIPGAPYPSTQISHQYRHSGTYQLTVDTFWQATYKVSGIGTFATGGDLVTQSTSKSIPILRAKSVLMR